MKNQLSNVMQKHQLLEKKYQSMIEKISDAFFLLDNDWCFCQISNPAAKFFKLPQEYLIGKNIWIEFPECADQPLRKAYEKALNTQEYIYAEENWAAGGLWLESHIYPSSDGLTVYFKDITRRKKKEIGFNKIAKRNALLLQMMQNSFLLTDEALNLVEVNPAFCKTIGYSREELLKMNVADFDPKLEQREINNRLNQARAIGVVEFETKNKKKNGEIIDVEVVLTEMEIDGIIYFASFGRDISERKRAEEQIINEKNLSDSFINSMPGIFYLYTKDGKFLRWNKNLETVSKFSAAEIAEKHPIDFFDVSEKKLLKKSIEKVFENGSAEVEANFLTKDKEKIPYYFNGRLTFIEGKPCLLGVGIDISKHKKADKAIRAMEKEILNQKVQEQKKISRAIIKTQEKERNYLGGELHDNVNQILATTRMYLNMASKKDAKYKNTLEYPLQLIDSAIHEIRLLTAKSVAPLRNIDLRHLINLLIDGIEKVTDINTVFVYGITTEKINDELKLNIYRIIQEQLNNIIKHAAASNVDIAINVNENILNILVSDDGKGFDSDKKRDGTGLYNIMNRIQSFNGEITIETSPGNGCILKVEIPFDI
jgi:PAS domain S-box-containing protein